MKHLHQLQLYISTYHMFVTIFLWLLLFRFCQWIKLFDVKWIRIYVCRENTRQCAAAIEIWTKAKMNENFAFIRAALIHLIHIELYSFIKQNKITIIDDIFAFISHTIDCALLLLFVLLLTPFSYYYYYLLSTFFCTNFIRSFLVLFFTLEWRGTAVFNECVCVIDLLLFFFLFSFHFTFSIC